MRGADSIGRCFEVGEDAERAAINSRCLEGLSFLLDVAGCDLAVRNRQKMALALLRGCLDLYSFVATIFYWFWPRSRLPPRRGLAFRLSSCPSIVLCGRGNVGSQLQINGVGQLPKLYVVGSIPIARSKVC